MPEGWSHITKPETFYQTLGVFLQFHHAGKEEGKKGFVVLVLWLQRVMEHLQSGRFVMFCKIPARRQERFR